MTKKISAVAEDGNGSFLVDYQKGTLFLNGVPFFLCFALDAVGLFVPCMVYGAIQIEPLRS